MIPRILIRHLTGSKAHRVEQFPLVDVDELTVGRARASHVSFDGQSEDTVSRRHAVIRIVRSGRPSFKIADLGSSNGLRVNGRPVRAEQDLGADDLVELGPEGPSFKLGIESCVLPAGDEPTVQRSEALAGPLHDPAPKRVGRRRVGRTALMSAAIVVIAALCAVFGPALVVRGRGWIAAHSRKPGAGAGDGATAARKASAAPAPSAPMMTAPGAVVFIEARWRLYDKDTGQPVYQKILLRHGQRLPCFVQTAAGRVVPWLTTEDDDHVNSPIGGVIRGSGFIFGSEGGIITSRHIAAGWTARYAPPARTEAALFRQRAEPELGNSFRQIDLAALRDGADLANWIPGEGGVLFSSRAPVAVATMGANLEGRNDSLNVVLPSSHASTPARLVLASNSADIAELRIDVGGSLHAIPLANAANAQPGQAVTVLFYPAPAATGLDQPAPAAGPPSTPHLASVNGTIVATHGDGAGALYELSIEPGIAAEGGPLIGADGTALGMVTSASAAGSSRIFAYPAGVARALLESQ